LDVLLQRLGIALPLAQTIIGATQAEAREPMLERRVGAVGAEFHPGAEERLLRHLLHLFRTPEKAPSETEDAALVCAHQGGEGVLVAVQAGPDQPRFGSPDVVG